MPSNKEPVKIVVRVQPNAHKNEIVGFQGDVLRIKIAAPPVDGKANRELVVFLSEVLGIRKSDIAIEKGENAKRKVIGISGITKARVVELTAVRSSAGVPKLL